MARRTIGEANSDDGKTLAFERNSLTMVSGKLIGYTIQHHGPDFQHLAWLVSRISEHAAFVHVFLDSAEEDVRRFAAVAHRVHPGIAVRRSMPVTWAGPSVMTQMREMLMHAVETDGWEYVINLSGSCIPTAHPKIFSDALRNAYRLKGKRNYVYGFVPRRDPFWLHFTASDHRKVVPYGRISVSCDKETAHALADGRLDPARQVMQRRGVFCSEVMMGTKKLLSLRGLHRTELADRRLFWASREYRVGRQWFVFHRSLVEWLCESSTAARVYDHLQQTFLPDECYFQVVLDDSDNPVRGEVDFQSNLRYRLGTPGELTEEALAHAMNEPCFFARKVSERAVHLRHLADRRLGLA